MNRLTSPAQLRASLIRWSLFCVPLVMLLGFLSGQVAGSAADNPWFAALDKPAIFPPPIAFPVVWTILYAMMGFALAMVCAARRSRWKPWAVAAFIFQLALNLAWSPTFFAAHELRLALGILIALDLAVATTIWLFWKVRREAAWLLLPYMGWILFASVLNWEFLQANPDAARIEADNAIQQFSL